MAALLRICDLTAVRVGHEEYARDNESFGLTTLRRRHARVEGREVELKFRGKSGAMRCVRLRDARLARVVQACRELHGHQLFQYQNAHGAARPVHAEHVNAYLRSLTRGRFSTKDFRTWSATVTVAVALRAEGPASSQRAAQQAVRAAIATAAEQLGNTPSVCRNSYVHPAIVEAYMRGECMPASRGSGRGRSARREDERCVLAFLETLSKGARHDATGESRTILHSAS